ncbi:MAG: cobalt transporter CbiM, partial [Proteus hauseri]|nr:cobalt transporter CbiM [Proteus hauseri]
MHLSEGVLHLPVLAGAGVVAAAGVAIGIRQLDTSRLSLAALFGAAFFVAGTIHVPIGVSSVHLILNGLAGLFLGWAVFPAFLIALALQVLFFSFGGFAVLGVNLCNISIPALLVYYLFRNSLRPGLSQGRLVYLGVMAGVIGTLGTVCLTSLALVLDS